MPPMRNGNGQRIKMTKGFKHVYGPVPSRRLGRSLGIDLAPFKTCTYDCVYCHLGRTTNKTIERKAYVAVDDVLEELKRKLDAGPAPDYISLAGSGEPTLNIHIIDCIDKIKRLTRIPVAVLTNGSLLWMTEVQAALMDADLVIPSLDAGDEALFRCVNRPHEEISFARMLEGLAAFTRRFPGEVWLEVLLLGGVTGIPAEARKLASLIRHIQPARVQLNTVCRPPAEDFAFAVAGEQMLALKPLFPDPVEIISDEDQGDDHAALLKPEIGDILALLRRRPCTLEHVAAGLNVHITEALKDIDHLIAAGKVKTVVSGGQRFYVASGE